MRVTTVLCLLVAWLLASLATGLILGPYIRWAGR